MGTKLKIIVFIFAVVIGLFAIQYMVTSVTNATSKKESFANDSGDDTPNEKKPAAKKDDAASKSKVDKEVKLNILETVETTFAQSYPDSDKKPTVFEMLTRKEHFEDIKEKYEEDSEGVTSHIRKLIKKTMSDLEDGGEKKEKTKEEYEQELMDKPLQTVVERLEQEDMRTRILSELDELSAKIATLQRDVKKLDGPAAESKEKENEKKVEAPKKETQGKKTESFSMMIEGFENRLNYASY